MQSYEPLKEYGPGLWVREGEWHGTAFRRKMTVMALKTGNLVVHNPFQLLDEDLRKLTSLGRVAAIVVPNAFHGDEAAWMAKQLPEAQVFVPAALRSKTRKFFRIDGALETDWPSAWNQDVECIPLGGMRLLHECAFYHSASRTLVLTDLVFNMNPAAFNSPIERKLMAWNRVGLGFGPSWICDHVFTRDTKARKHSILSILERDFDRVIMNHGDVVHSGGKQLMRAAFHAGA